MTSEKSLELARLYFEQQRLLGIEHLYLEKSPEPSIETLDRLLALHKDCKRCGLGAGRTRYVFGEGSPKAALLFIGEAPGFDEDQQGRPFVGKAGQLLDKIILAMGLRREEVYIANILKCRPPDNRPPNPEEAETCKPVLLRQISMIRPKFICCLGRTAAHNLLNLSDPMNRLRGKFYDFMGARLMVTYHPAALLRKEELKRDAWEDMKMLMREMGLKIPERSQNR